LSNIPKALWSSNKTTGVDAALRYNIFTTAVQLQTGVRPNSLYIYILNNNYTDKTQCKIKKTKINQKISNEIEKIKISRAQFSKYFPPRFSLANFYEIELTQVKAGFPFSILQDDQNFYFVV